MDGVVGWQQSCMWFHPERSRLEPQAVDTHCTTYLSSYLHLQNRNSFSYIIYLTISSAECKKVVSDIFGEIEFLMEYENKGLYQGSLKGESVVAAILPSRMEQSYCTSGFFRFQARFLTSSAPILIITHYLRTVFHQTRNLTHLR